MKRTIIIGAALFLPLFVFSSFEFSSRPQALTQKFRLDRFVSNPQKALKKLFANKQCGFSPAFAAVQDHASSDIASCDCVVANLAETWNDCLSCIFMGTLGLYNTLGTYFNQAIDPDVSVDTRIPIESNAISILAESSSVTGFDRYTHLVDDDGDICMALYYSKDSSDVDRVKGLLLLNTEQCPLVDDVAHAMAVKFDIGYTDEDIQTASIFDTGNYDGGAFDVTGAGTDAIFYMAVTIDDTGVNTETTVHSFQIVANAALKFFVNGQDDTLLRIQQKLGVALNDTVVTDADMDPDPMGIETKCYDDTSNTDLNDMTNCDTAGYSFSNFPFTVNSVSGVAYPTWNVNTITVTEAAEVESYF